MDGWVCGCYEFLNVISSSLQNQYSLTRAQQSYKSLVQIHEKNGKDQDLALNPFDGQQAGECSERDLYTRARLCGF